MTWTDGSGPSARVTAYTYDLNGWPLTMDGPLESDTITYHYHYHYHYHEKGRLSSYQINEGTDEISVEGYGYDNLDHLDNVTSPASSVQIYYDGDTHIVTHTEEANTGIITEYERLPVNQDQLLTAILHKLPASEGGAELARYDYTYTAQQQIATWQQKQPGMTPREWVIGYDARQQVTSVVESPIGIPPQLPQQVWRYQHDGSGNRIAACC